MSDQIPGWEGTVGPFPGQYGKPHVYARDVHSGAGNCVCGRDPGHRLHVQIAPWVPARPLPLGVIPGEVPEGVVPPSASMATPRPDKPRIVVHESDACQGNVAGWDCADCTDDACEHECHHTEPVAVLRDQLTEALTREHYRRAGERIEASPEEHCAAFAAAVLPIVQAERRRALADLDAGRVTAEELAAAGLDPGHTIDLRDDGWTLQHPLTCRTDLFACPVNCAAERDLTGPPHEFGRFECGLDDDGRLVIGGAQ